MSNLVIRPVTTTADRKRFVDLVWDVYRDDPAWVPPLKDEMLGLITPGKNPWFEHAEAALWLAERAGRPVGRISAQVDELVLQHMGAGTGQWGSLELVDGETEAGPRLIATAEDWLRTRKMTRAVGPFTLSIWDEPGLLIKGFDEPPTAMMGHHRPGYEAVVEGAGYTKAKDLYTYELDIRIDMIPMVQKLIDAGRRSKRIRMRPVDKSRFDSEAHIILTLLNDAWSGNWGFIPLTEAEIAYAGKKLKPIIYEDLVTICEVANEEGVFEPAAFMITLPDLNELTGDLNGKLFPFGFLKLLWRLRKPRVKRMRVPLMGVASKYQGSRLASQLAFMMIEECRRASVEVYGASHGEFGWVLEDNQGMMSIAQLPGSGINKIYRIYEKAL
ncbi:N-acetyltransferase [Sphingomonas sp. LHG3406-1]|uniref:N-acetyltransferase n=1 Tax=Sphingomonas sp. LHG3406-1 TaxID=2804617 RepID=UPI00261AB0A8|nr:N-acetyltransferase [Sphingomonas sp. LHG3406-1]